jgi:hypothetical protein
VTVNLVPGRVQVSASGGLTAETSFARAAVRQIIFLGRGEADQFSNRTNIPCTANGGSGPDLLVGGSANDYLAGGPGNDSLYGQDGNDCLVGGGGQNLLFGGPGYDVFIGATNRDAIWPGAQTSAVSTPVGRANSPPTVAAAARATLHPVTGTRTTLSVLGTDDGGEANLKYTWTALGLPAGAAAPRFSANGTNAAKNTVATFSRAGVYTLRATITDAAGLAVASNVGVTVDATLSSVAVSPGSVSLAEGQSRQFTATARDQFGNLLSRPPAFSWSLSGIGSLSSKGLYVAPINSGTAFVQASAGGKSGTAAVKVMAGSMPPPGISFDPATGVLTFQGTDGNDVAGVKPATLNTLNATMTSRDSAGNVILYQGIFLSCHSDNVTDLPQGKCHPPLQAPRRGEATASATRHARKGSGAPPLRSRPRACLATGVVVGLPGTCTLPLHPARRRCGHALTSFFPVAADAWQGLCRSGRGRRGCCRRTTAAPRPPTAPGSGSAAAAATDRPRPRSAPCGRSPPSG